MGLFHKLIKKTEKEAATECPEQTILKIAGLISHQNQAVVDELKECLSNVEAYFSSHPDMLEEWVLEDVTDAHEPCRIALVHILEQANYVCIRDWKDEKEDFLYFVQNLEGFQNFDLTLNPDWLDEDGSIAEWSAVLDRMWQDKNCCLTAIDIESDSYVLFLCDGKTLKKLQSCAESIGYHIGPAKEM